MWYNIIELKKYYKSAASSSCSRKKKNMNIVKELQAFINRVEDARSNEDYTGDYSITIAAEGKSLTVPLDYITFDDIGYCVLLHMNIPYEE